MPRYKTKPTYVQAEVYRLGLEDGFTSAHTFVWGASDELKPYVLNKYNHRLSVSEGDYIVTSEDKGKEVYNPRLFNALFELDEET